MMKKNVFQKIGLTAVCCLFLCAGALIAQSYSTTELITSSKTVTVPATAISVTFEAWGAGGAGGYVQQGVLNVAAGGGGGAYAKKVVTYPNIASDYQVTVGQGGKHVLTTSWGYITSAVSTDGGSSVVTTNGTTVVEAVGGKTVRNGSRDAGLGGAASDCTGDVAFSGGRGGNAPVDFFVDEWFSGGGGGAAGIDANGGNARDAAFLVSPLKGEGGAGNPVSGDGGEPQNWLRAGNAGVVYGGGGSGAQASVAAKNGGPGANGVVRVTIVTSEPEQFVCGTSKVSDGNMSYNTVDINGVCWMRENLQANVEGSSYFNDDPNANMRFGRLYTYDAAASACPAGWALPTQAQLDAVYAYAAENFNGEADTRISETEDPEAWLPQVARTNGTGFSAMGAGMYNGEVGQYENLLGYTAFWTVDGATATTANVIETVYSCDAHSHAPKNKNDMYSVRCVKVQ